MAEFEDWQVTDSIKSFNEAIRAIGERVKAGAEARPKGSYFEPLDKVPNPPRNDYQTIYADPPWAFATRSDKGKGRAAESHYDCMTLDEIKALPVGEWAAEDCVLLMWVTDPFLRHGLDVVESWGFEYKTVGFYWVKLSKGWVGAANVESNWSFGTGYWTRANPEQCLLATKGHPKRLHANVRKLVVSPRREHSRKPDEVYERIERLCAGPYLEMFSRFDHPGWDRWGGEDGIGARRWRSDMKDQ